MAAMRRGDFASAWRVSDAVLRDRSQEPPPPDLPLHLRAVWDGAPLAGRRVLVRCYHGLGDALQFLCLTRPLAALAAAVAVEAPAVLLPLLRGLPGVGRLVALGEDPGPFDVEIEVQELPHALRLEPVDLGQDVPYLAADPAAVDGLRRRLAGEPGLAVGLVWTAGAWHPARSVPLALLAPLARVPGVRLHSLQDGPAAAERASLPALRDLAAPRIEDLAATIAALDLVISVDTMVAHLAGALGRPTWTLLHDPADWRWMEGRDDSPWYPTMRLYRQQRGGDWTAPLAAMARDLAILANQ